MGGGFSVVRLGGGIVGGGVVQWCMGIGLM